MVDAWGTVLAPARQLAGGQHSQQYAGLPLETLREGAPLLLRALYIIPTALKNMQSVPDPGTGRTHAPAAFLRGATAVSLGAPAPRWPLQGAALRNTLELRCAVSLGAPAPRSPRQGAALRNTLELRCAVSLGAPAPRSPLQGASLRNTLELRCAATGGQAAPAGRHSSGGASALGGLANIVPGRGKFPAALEQQQQQQHDGAAAARQQAEPAPGRADAPARGVDPPSWPTAAARAGLYSDVPVDRVSEVHSATARPAMPTRLLRRDVPSTAPAPPVPSDCPLWPPRRWMACMQRSSASCRGGWLAAFTATDLVGGGWSWVHVYQLPIECSAGWLQAAGRRRPGNARPSPPPACAGKFEGAHAVFDGCAMLCRFK